jgi:hypothetical protein
LPERQKPPESFHCPDDSPAAEMRLRLKCELSRIAAMEISLVLFWIGVNTIIGYAIGKSKNDVSSCVFLSVLLGPQHV